MNAENHIPVDRTALEKLCSAMFQKVGLTAEDADLSAQILVSADARGIPSHGVGRMMRYIKGIECKQMLPDAIPEILHESPVSITVDANGAMGFPVSYTMLSMRTVVLLVSPMISRESPVEWMMYRCPSPLTSPT